VRTDVYTSHVSTSLATDATLAYLIRCRGIRLEFELDRLAMAGTVEECLISCIHMIYTGAEADPLRLRGMLYILIKLEGKGCVEAELE